MYIQIVIVIAGYNHVSGEQTGEADRANDYIMRIYDVIDTDKT